MSYAARFALVAAAYAAAAVAGLQYAVVPGAGTSVWPAAGIAFAALVLGGLQLWPAIVVGRLATALIVGSPTPLWADLLVALATTLGAVAPVWAVKRHGKLDPRLDSMRAMVWLTLGGGLAGAAISATLGCGALWLAGTELDRLGAAWLNWASGYFVGVLCVAPLLLAWSRRDAWTRPPLHWAHLLLCLAAVALLSWLVFLTPQSFALRTWHVLPVLVWAALAFNVRGVSAALIVLSVFAVAGAVNGTGPLASAGADPIPRVLLTQQFIAVTGLTMLFLAAISDERRDVVSHARLAAIVSTSPEAILTTDARGVIQTWNAGAERLFGWSASKAVGSSALDLMSPPGERAETEERLRRVAAGEALIFETQRLGREGELIDVGVTAAPLRSAEGAVIGVSAVMRDIRARKAAEAALRGLNETLEARVAERTRELELANASLRQEVEGRRAAEAQVRQLQKMEAVGQLTGGIAHDFNNMLAVVIGSLDMARRRLKSPDPAVSRLLDAAADGADRAAKLTARLLAFSRQQPLSPQVVDANRLVAGMSELLRRTLGESNRIETVQAGGLWPIHVDAAQLESAILNLAVNARDAMPDGGRLTIETANAHLDDVYVETAPDVSPGQYVQISVTDTGEGMTKAVLERVFDPFFTTKEVGKGTGLGLSMVYGFVKQSGGHVRLYSEVGHGTTVKIYLPRWFGVVEAVTPSEPAEPPRGGREIVLVVEDEAQVRRLSVEMLTTLGYAVIEADSAEAALSQLATDAEVTLLFTDVVMPDTNGRKLAERALALRPGLKVLYTTGYSRNAVVHNGVLDPDVAFLPKPFTMEQLGKKVRAVLDGRAT